LQDHTMRLLIDFAKKSKLLVLCFFLKTMMIFFLYLVALVVGNHPD
jgi:hypothetical protein